MTSTDLHRKISAFVAHRLNEDEYRARVRNTVRPCEDCGPTFTRDLIARIAMSGNGRAEPIADRGHLIEGEQNAEAAATERRPSADEDAATARPERSLADVVSTSGIIVALIVIVAALGLLFRSDEPVDGLAVRAADEAVPVDVNMSQPQNLFNEAVRSFAQVVHGEIGVQVSGEKRRELEEYFANNGISYSVRFPSVSLPLSGGIVTRYGGRAYAQLVYAAKDRAVYVIEVPTSELREGTRLYVTQDILDRLDKGEKIQEVTAEGESLVMFRDGDLVITAVGNMEPEELARAVRGA